MGLANSIIVTGIIVAAVWALAIFQPRANAIETKPTNALAATNIAKAYAETAVDTPAKAAPTKTQAIGKTKEAKAVNSVNISGITMRLSLDNTDPLWQTFDQATELHNQLIKQPKKLYVVYQSFDQEYSKATVTVGYDTKLLPKARTHKTLPISNFKTLLVRSDYDQQSLKTGWQKINYGPSLQSVVEVHYLNGKGEPEQSELLVSYQ